MAVFAKLALLAGVAIPVCAQTVSTVELAAHAKAAQDAERRSDFGAAVHNYEYLARALPKNAEIQSNLGVALYFQHDYEQAIHTFAKAIAMNQDLLAPHLFTGLAWYQLSNPDAAVPELAKAVNMNASDVMARTWLGYAYVAQGNYAGAAETFRVACGLDPNNVDAWYALGQSYLQLGEDATRELLAASPDGGRVWQLAGEQFALRGQSDRAIGAYQESLKRRPDLEEVRQKLLQLGDTTIAAEDSTPPPTAGREDACYQRAHDAEIQAHSAWEHVAHIAPDSYRAHQILADSLLAEGRADEAVAEYRKVLEQKSDLPGIHEVIGTIMRKENKLPEALSEYEQELAMHPHSASAAVNTAHALMLMGDDTRAEKLLRSALKMDRPPAEAYLWMGRLELRHNDAPAAIVSLKYYLATTKDNSDAYYLLARAYRATGNTNEMNQALAAYKNTSQDAKQRNLAQKELEAMNSKQLEREEPAEDRPVTIP